MQSGLISHPNVVSQILMLLYSINERVGGNPGLNTKAPDVPAILGDAYEAMVQIGQDREVDK